MAGQNMDKFEEYFRRADLDQDGRISGAEIVAFFQGSNLPKEVLAKIWTFANQNQTSFLGRAEFYNALKLVTVAQSKRELTPDIVRAALYGPASARIPAPQINLLATAVPQPNLRASSSAPQLSSVAPAASQGIGIRGPQGFSPQQAQTMRPPRPPPPTGAFQSQHGGVGPGMPSVGTTSFAHPPTSNVPNNPRDVSPSTNQDGFGLAASGLTPSAQPRPQSDTGLMQPAVSKLSDPTSPALQAGSEDFKEITVSGNGSASDSLFGVVFSATSVQSKEDSTVPTTSGGGLAVSSGMVPASAGAPATFKSSPLGSLQNTSARPPLSGQYQQVQPTVKQNPPVSVQSSTGFPVANRNSASVQIQQPWPRMTASDVQKYSKVFEKVDTDRDGKITGEQARDLFLSWKQPREVLRQIWNLSDQDNDSMLSLREFCIAVYLMERFREGRPLPTVLPSGIMFDDAPRPAFGQPAASPYGNAAWRPSPGFQQQHGMTGGRPPVAPVTGGRPPRPAPAPIHQSDEAAQPSKPKPRVPELEKDLLEQLSTEEQNSLNSKFQEATEADKKIQELEKEILESKEKIDFFRAKMQELVLYKSRCDNRLNEITARVSADKHEVESLAKKYEDKYKQTGDVASRLTIEEATFRDIQEKKMEVYREIVKMEQDGKTDAVQDRAIRIQLDLEQLVKALNERCKTYGLRAKPTSLVELPFGWQPGIQEGAADWDEDWDKFEDEGFTFVKEFTQDVKNVIVPPRPKSTLMRTKESSTDESVTAVPSPNDNAKSENIPGGEGITKAEVAHAQNKDVTGGSPPDSPTSKNEAESPSKQVKDSQSRKDAGGDASPQAEESHSDRGDSESVLSGEKGINGPGWGRFDIPYDTDLAWNTKDMDNEKHGESLFGPDDWGLNPIKTHLTGADNMFQQNSTFTFDSVPSTPAADDLFHQKSTFAFDSVPGTPAADDLYPKKSAFAFDSVPSTPAYNGSSSHIDNLFQRKNQFSFADSLPSTPMFSSGNSPRRFSEGSEEHSFDKFSRFDSFNSHDGGLFPSRESFPRFDSFRSTADSEYDHGFMPQREAFSRFDSMRSTRDSDYDQGFFPPRESVTRFDTMRSTGAADHGVFQRFDSMRSTADSEFGNDLFAQRESLARFDSTQSTRDSDYTHGFTSFDDADPFGSSDPFKSSPPGQTKKESDSWKAF